MHPEQAKQLRTAYADRLDDMLASAGFTEGMFVNPRLPAGTVYVCQAGNVGTVGFEVPLTVETWRDPGTRSWWVRHSPCPRSPSTGHSQPRKSSVCHNERC